LRALRRFGRLILPSLRVVMAGRQAAGAFGIAALP
jgi:hypothetical protein